MPTRARDKASYGAYMIMGAAAPLLLTFVMGPMGLIMGLQAAIPMNRLGSADECAGSFLFLASDAMSAYVTGQVLGVNGGIYM